jgi:hypothetical protein
MNMQPGYRLDFILSVVVHSLLPILSLVLVGIGGWFLGMRALDIQASAGSSYRALKPETIASCYGFLDRDIYGLSPQALTAT